MSTATPLIGSVVTHTITLASLASDTNLVAGIAGTAINNGSAGDDAVDCILGGKFTTGSSPTNNKQIEVWIFSTYDGGSTYSGGASGSNASLTPDAKSLMRLFEVVPTDNTSNKSYRWGGRGIAALFGGVLPEKWGVYVVHNTGVALNSTAGNHEVKHTPIKYESN